jgi:hypothetical protein
MGEDDVAEKRAIHWLVAVVFSLASLTMGISAGIVAIAEPGAARVTAGAVAVFLFLLLVFGLAGAGEESKAVLVRRLLVAASRRPLLSSALMVALTIAFTWLGPARTGFVVVHCLDAKRISHRAVPGRRLEECGADKDAAFTAWYPWGRAALLSSVRCNYASGDSVPILDNEPSCPLHEFTYAQTYDKTGKSWQWRRGLDGWWQERASSDNAYSHFKEIGPLTIEAPAEDSEAPKLTITGVVVRRVLDANRMELLIPRSVSSNTRLYIRDTPSDPWRPLGTLVDVP